MKTATHSRVVRKGRSGLPVKTGRPPGNKETGPLRNFRFEAKTDKFLLDEKGRTGRDMVSILEHALLALKAMKPQERDQAFYQMRKAA